MSRHLDYTIASASSVASMLGGYKLVNGWWRGRGVCHDTPNRDSTSLAFRDPPTPGASLAVKCWKGVGCNKNHIRDTLERLTGLHVRPRKREPDTVTPPPKPATPKKLSGTSVEIPRDSEHPGRLYIKRRNVWLPGAILPAAIRWLPDETQARVGSILAAGAPPPDWLKAWPEMPRPTGVHKIHVDAEGNPAEDAGGLNKRSYGNLVDACCILGDPRPGVACGAIVVEGVADGLALASRRPETVICLFGTSTFKSKSIAEYLGNFQRLRIYSDSDGPGVEAAIQLMKSVKIRTGNNCDVMMVPPHKEGMDPASVAETEPPMDQGRDDEREMAVELYQSGLPIWEACRLAWTSLRDLGYE